MSLDAQERVVAFADRHELDADPVYRILDLSAEVGEIAADAAKSTEYGTNTESLAVSRDEIGDALFSLLLVADAVDVDAGAALDDALEKYEKRLDETGSAGSSE